MISLIMRNTQSITWLLAYRWKTDVFILSEDGTKEINSDSPRTTLERILKRNLLL